MHTAQRLGQSVAVQGLVDAGDVAVAGSLQPVHRGVVNAFQQQDPDAGAIE